ncbi:lysophospholipid acyltransferase family protein [Candidatus Xianfuyuplasma coldseepsis]|uniref:1-acyl-sn-glycerol-3-phosphate acyltransferase n=1 Tax=Candidatus Xianfuyuplasma coldseepsis TaxID=2782163 RepID=A0A7L7KRU5_9MOLU|nr:lysophospholipid acyltransferase family protein [Xianfuyuplasma coldseepsis]QMS85139.1 1-acyl-sn-glycerol-3-phosphate acyltransferase [Xianfuyuplasma coldseepsis]
MLTTYILLVYFATIGGTIYLFDYRVDQVVDNPFVIIISFVIAFVVALIAAIIWLEVTYLLIAKRYPTTSKVKHFFGKAIVQVPLHLFRVKATVIGKENLPKDPGFLIYANHTSELDISALMCTLPEYPVAFLAKQEVRSYLSIGRWAESIGCVMLNRESARQGSEAVSKVVERVQHGSTMVIFPEGGVNREIGVLRKFRSGAFKVALESKVPIVPITIVKEPRYYKKKWPMKKHLDLVIHPPIPYEQYKELSSRQVGLLVREVIENTL